MSARWAHLLLAAGSLALLAAPPALTQEMDPRSDELAQNGRQPATKLLSDETAGDQDFRSTYVTWSAGAIPDEDGANTAGGLDKAAGGDPLTNAPIPTARPAVPTTSTQSAGAAQTMRTRSTERLPAVEPVSRRAEAIEARIRKPDETPYAPLGLRLGTFIVMPSLEQGVTGTSNASSSPGGSSAVLSETTLRLNAASDWSRHSAALGAHGIFQESVSGEDVSSREGGVEGSLLLDLGGDFRAAASAAYDIRPESAASPVDLPAVTSRPLSQTLTAAAGLEKHAGKLRVGVRGAVERQQFGDASLQGGGELSQRERDFVLTSAVLRAGYEISPALTPFIEGEIGRRTYDLPVDSGGYERSASRVGVRAGVTLDLGEKFFGELSGGWIQEDFDDARLARVSAATVNADLFWSPVRGTLVGLQASTAVEGTTTPGESGSVLYSGRLSIERELRANLIANAALGASWRDYAGDDEGYDLMLDAEAGMTYWLNRYAGLTGRARHETVRSGDPGRESRTSSVFLGVKLQR